MAGITLLDAEEKLALYLAALDAVLNNQSYTINGRSLTRANLKDIESGVDFWDKKVKSLDAGGRRVRLGTPV